MTSENNQSLNPNQIFSEIQETLRRNEVSMLEGQITHLCSVLSNKKQEIRVLSLKHFSVSEKCSALITKVNELKEKNAELIQENAKIMAITVAMTLDAASLQKTIDNTLKALNTMIGESDENESEQNDLQDCLKELKKVLNGKQHPFLQLFKPETHNHPHDSHPVDKALLHRQADDFEEELEEETQKKPLDKLETAVAQKTPETSRLGRSA